MSANQESSGSSELHLAVAAVSQSVLSSPGGESQSAQQRSLVRRARDDHRSANRRSRSWGPYQPSEVASDLSGLEAGRFELDDEGLQQGSTFVDARSIHVGIPPEIAPRTAAQFADTVRSATIAEAELKHSQMIHEARRVSSQNARDEVIAEAEIRHQQVVQSMSQSSIEHAQNLSNHVAPQVRHDTLAEAESRRNEILRETIQHAERVHSQTMDEVRNQSSARDASIILELQSQIAHLTRANQDLLARLEAAASSGSVRALPAQGNQGGCRQGSDVDMFGWSSPSEPNPQPSNTNDLDTNQVLPVLQEEVQNLRDEIGKKKKGKGRNDSSDLSEGSPSLVNLSIALNVAILLS